ncbi:MAG: hypothetical protein M1820_005459 [Bogoriella megaspora]|nr:MAG: hypothetical protein M1820_005459 [Bogoriella megaspora]
MSNFERLYEKALEAGVLPGAALTAVNRDGSFQYAKAIGYRSKRPGQEALPLQLDTMLTIASCTKLLTAISALQCVEKGLLSLDEDVKTVLPEVGSFGIISGFEETTGRAVLTPNASPITLRHLLTHTSGLTYDLMNPLLARWRESRGEQPWRGATVEEKANVPLIFEPGKSWAYGPGADWTGKLIERVTGESLEAFMSKHIWKPLEVSEMTFWPSEREGLSKKLSDIFMLDQGGKAQYAPDVDINYGAKDCLGGGGLFASANAYMAVLQAVLRKDSRLLTSDSYDELLRPQLNEQCRHALGELLQSDQQLQDFLGVNIPLSAPKDWSLAGIVSKDEQEDWMKENTVLWSGATSLIWFIDSKAGLCGLAASQVLPPMAPPITKLHKKFHEGMYGLFLASKQ